MSAITSVLDDAWAGHGSSLCFSGPPGIGKTSLLDAAEAAATGFDCLRATGVPGEFAIGHAGLADIVTPLRPWLSEIPPPQRAALDSVLGWSEGGSQNERFLVGAATVSLLSMASQHRPVLVLVDDLQWIDRESLTAPAVRRAPDPARCGGVPDGTKGRLDGAGTVRHQSVSPLRTERRARRRPAHRTENRAHGRRTAGHRHGRKSARDPRGGPAARARAAPRVRSVAIRPPRRAAARRRLPGRPGRTVGRRALVIAAASMDRAAGPVVAALHAENIDAEALLSEAERVGALTLAGGTLTFRHPLIRAAVWHQASAGEQRWAPAALATALKDRPAESIRHRAEATIGSTITWPRR